MVFELAVVVWYEHNLCVCVLRASFQKINLILLCETWLHQRDIRWDETTETCLVDADKSGRMIRSAWQLMVTRIWIAVIWPSGACLEMRVATSIPLRYSIFIFYQLQWENIAKDVGIILAAIV